MSLCDDISGSNNESKQNENTPSSPSSSQQHAKGIDIKAAMSILSSRQPHSHHDHECHSVKDNDVRKTMGQTIHLISECDADGHGPNKEGKACNDGGVAPPDNHNKNNAEQKAKEEQQQKRKEEREKEILQTMEKMSIRELLKTVMNVQKERVETYRTYESGLQNVLSSGNVTTYPNVCANVTATFSVLSQTIRTVQTVLQEAKKKRKDLILLLKNLQAKECEKLNLTAALHLEKMRERDHRIGLEMENISNNEDDDSNENGHKKKAGEERIGELLRKGVASLTNKLSNCIEDINEVLEELRYALAEEEEEEG
mmetsp:Transcript_14164/g.20767  ORF Transcript_14164/g.20767 Transcript_14164/m.20767 type:complete len:313 (+) Transcript_14164:145-1083(+)